MRKTIGYIYKCECESMTNAVRECLEDSMWKTKKDTHAAAKRLGLPYQLVRIEAVLEPKAYGKKAGKR